MEADPLFHKRGFSWFVIVAAVFLVRSFSWFSAELWYDEVLTLTRFVLNPQDSSLLHVFRDYPIANNHILSTAIYWIWTRIVGIPDETLLRAPSILLGLGTIAIVMRHWRRWLGDCLATIGGFMLAISPVFTAYAYQIRGYALTFFLATVAISGALELVGGQQRRGQLLVCLSSLLLPLVMPSNAILAPALVTFIFMADAKRLPWTKTAARVLPCGCAFVLGTAYYLTIWEQFKHAMAEPDGWSSAWQVGGNILLAFLAHALVGILVIAWPRKAQEKQAEQQDSHELQDTPQELVAANLPQILTMLAVIAATIGGVLFCSRPGHAPFPRVTLVFWPPLTFAVLALMQLRNATHRTWPFATMAILVLCNGILWERFATSIADFQMQNGRVPDNLLQQYYRGSTDLRKCAQMDLGDRQNIFIVTDAYDIMAFRFYWSLSGAPAQQAAGDNELPDNFLASIPHDESLQLYALAKSPEAAAGFYQKAGLGDSKALVSRLESVARFSLRTLYRLK